VTTSFKDTEGREWLLRIEVNAIRRVRTVHGIDLNQLLGDQSVMQRLYGDVCLLVDVIHELCRSQCEARNVSPEQFGEGLAGDALEAATIAFGEALIEYLPPAKRRLMRQVVDASKAAEAQATLRIDNAIEKGLLTSAITSEMKKLDQALSTLQTPAPAAESTFGKRFTS
jgi:hypothetical protein